MYGSTICIGENQKNQAPVPSQKIYLASNFIDAEAQNNGKIDLVAQGGGVSILADNIWEAAAKNIYGYAFETAYFGGLDTTILFGANIQVGPPGNQGIPSPSGSVVLQITPTDEIDMFAGNEIFMSGINGGVCNLIEAEAANIDLLANYEILLAGTGSGPGGTGADLIQFTSNGCYSNNTSGTDSTDLQVLTINGRTIYNEHTHRVDVPGVGIIESNPPDQNMDDTCVSIQFFVQPGFPSIGG